MEERQIFTIQLSSGERLGVETRWMPTEEEIKKELIRCASLHRILSTSITEIYSKHVDEVNKLVEEYKTLISFADSIKNTDEYAEYKALKGIIDDCSKKRESLIDSIGDTPETWTEEERILFNTEIAPLDFMIARLKESSKVNISKEDIEINKSRSLARSQALKVKNQLENIGNEMIDSELLAKGHIFPHLAISGDNHFYELLLAAQHQPDGEIMRHASMVVRENNFEGHFISNYSARVAMSKLISHPYFKEIGANIRIDVPFE